jgi:hypothetical protein
MIVIVLVPIVSLGLSFSVTSFLLLSPAALFATSPFFLVLAE